MINMKLVIIILAIIFVVACAGVKARSDGGYVLTQNVVYKTIDSQPLAGDMYIPESTGLRPAVVVVHGGGWTNRSGDMAGISRRLAKVGFAVFNITYRLAPEDRHPAQVEDVSAALEWLYTNAEQYQIDSTRISGWGYSAGAHLILLAGLDRQRPPYLKSIVAGGTPADLTAWPNSPLVLKLLGKPLAGAEAEWQDASPVNHVTRQSPPVFLYHGQWDALVEPEQMAMMKTALDEKGVSAKTYTVKFLGHIATYALASGAEQQGMKFISEQSK